MSESTPRDVQKEERKRRVMELIARTVYEPRPYQMRIISNCIGLYGSGQSRSIMIESPTGSGKTAMSSLICQAMQDEHGGRLDQGGELAIGWIAMRRNLLTQARQEQISKGLNVDVDFISMFQKELPERLLKAKKRMLVIDEAHHDAASSCAHIHTVVKPTYVLGMTATTFRTDRMKLCFDKIIKDSGLGALVRDGYLAQYDHYTIKDWRLETVLQTYLSSKEKWGKSIFYFHNVAQCYEFNERLLEHGVKSDVVTGDTAKEEQIEAFKRDETEALVNCMVLTEGLDVPSLKTVFCRPSCKGVTMQMCGRAFRKHPTIARKNVVQCQSSPWPFNKTAEPKESYVWQDGAWMALKVNDKLDEINQNVIIALANTEVSMPKFIIDKQMQQRGRGRRRRRL